MTNENIKENLRDLGKISRNAKISKDLKRAVDDSIKAIEKGDLELACELTGVKSYVVGDMNLDPKEHHFREDNDYNEKKLGRSVYGMLDSIHHDLSFSLDEVPSGVMIFTSGGVVSKGKSERKNPTFKLIREEDERIRMSVYGTKKPKAMKRI